ncbi:MAG: hypothetical protein AB7F40_01600 [Victivallaceae bacterium]|nr:hypothetical protein [Victivallaceae bacterium]
MFSDKLLIAFNTAWDMLYAWPLPARLRALRRLDGNDDYAALLAFPAAGLTYGVLIFILAKILVLVFGVWAGSLVFSVVATVLTLLKDRGRGFTVLMSAVSGWVKWGSLSDALRRLDPRDWRNDYPAFLPLFIVICFAIFLGGFALIAGRHPEWLIAVGVIPAAAAGLAAAYPAAGRNGIVVSEKQRWHVWLPAVFVMLFYLGRPAAPVLSLAAAVGVTWYLKCFSEGSGGANPAFRSLAPAAAELAAIMAGVLTIY